MVDLYVSLSRFIFCYTDPDQRFLKWIWIRTRPNDTDPTGSKHITQLQLRIFEIFFGPILFAQSRFNMLTISTTNISKMYSQKGTNS